MEAINIIGDISAAFVQVTRYKLGKRLAEAGLKESLKRFICAIECENARLVIVFSHQGALMEFELDKQNFLARAREYYKKHAGEFSGAGFVPKRIDAKVRMAKKPNNSEPIVKKHTKGDDSFVNNVKDPQIHALFESYREAIKLRKDMENNTDD